MLHPNHGPLMYTYPYDRDPPPEMIPDFPNTNWVGMCGSKINDNYLACSRGSCYLLNEQETDKGWIPFGKAIPMQSNNAPCTTVRKSIVVLGGFSGSKLLVP